MSHLVLHIKYIIPLFCFSAIRCTIICLREFSCRKLQISQNCPKRHFWPPLPQNARECFAPLCLNTTRPAKTNLKTPARQPDPNSLQSPSGMAGGANETHFLQETLNGYFFTFLRCCENENLEIRCSY